MATTPKGIYYPNDYNEIADIPEDMKKMAESIEEVFEDTDSDLSDIKEEQTTQNNRLNSLEVDNTTNKSDILTNKQEINNIKTEQTEQNTNISTNATNIESLQEENENLKKIVAQMPQVTGQGTSITLENTIEAPFTIFDEEGNSTQETTEGKNKVDVTSGNLYNVPETLTLTQREDGRLFLNGKMNGTTTQLIFNMNFANIENGKTYKIVTKVVSGTWDKSIIGMQFRNSNGQQIQTLQNSSSAQESKVIEGDVAEVRLYFGGTFEATNLVIEIMLVEASVTDDSFEKFTYGASPNPNYEQPILSSGDNIQLFDGELELGTLGSTGANNSSTTDIRSKNYVSVDERETYTISSDKGSSASLRFYDTNKTFISTMTGASMPRTFETPENAKYVRFVIPSTTDIDAKVKLEKGNKASGYSPYGMGSINEKIQNKNKMTYPLDFEITNNGIRSKQAKGTYNLNGTTTSSGNFLVQQNFIKSIKIQNGDYLHIMNSSANSNVAMILCFSDGSIDSAGLITANRIYDLSNSVGKTLVGIRFYCNSANINISINLTPMIINNSTSTPYVEHEEQDYPIFVQQPMRSIGDVRDVFFKNTVDSPYYDENLTLNGWYERHFIARKIFDGTEDWQFYTNSVTGLLTFRILMNEIKLLNHRKILSNNFKVVDSYTPINGEMDNHFDNYYNLECVYTEMKNVTEFKNWLAQKYTNGNPVYIDYILETPLDLPCTEEQIQQLENLPSTYKEMTIIQSQDETPAYLEVAGIRDINTMFDKVTNAIVSLGGNV